MARDHLDRNQELERARLLAMNTTWLARSRGQRLGLMLLAVAAAWATLSVVVCLFWLRVGLSPLGWIGAVSAAAVIAAMLLARAIWPAEMIDWSVRSSVPRDSELDRAFPGWGDVRPQEYPSHRTRANQAPAEQATEPSPTTPSPRKLGPEGTEPWSDGSS